MEEGYFWVKSRSNSPESEGYAHYAGGAIIDSLDKISTFSRPSMISQPAGLLQGAVAAGLLVAFVYLHIIKFYWRAYKLRHIKGPPAIPVLGSLYDVRAVSWYDWLESLRSQYGKVFRVTVFTRPYIVMLDKAAVREILTDDAFVKSQDYSLFRPTFGDGLITIAGPKHAADRAFLNPFFTLPKLLKNLDVICKCAANTIDKTLMKSVGKEMDIVHDLTSLAADCIFFVALSIRETLPVKEAFITAIGKGSKIINQHSILSLPFLTSRLRIVGVMQTIYELHHQLDDIIDERLRLHATSPDTCPDDILTAMISRKPPCSRQEIYDHTVTFLAAGTETTGYCLAYTLLLLARHPEVQQKLKQEVRRVLGQRTNVTPEDYKNLTYVTNVMQESLRIYSPVPQMMRLATRTVTLESSGLVIPEGSEVLMPLYLLHRDVDEWGAPIDTFNPDRYQTDGPKGKPITREAPSKGYLPFSFGKHSCIGGTLALVEGTIVLALLAQRFTFHEVPGFEPQLGLGVTLESSNGVKVRLELDESMEHTTQ